MHSTGGNYLDLFSITGWFRNMIFFVLLTVFRNNKFNINLIINIKPIPAELQ